MNGKKGKGSKTATVTMAISSPSRKASETKRARLVRVNTLSILIHTAQQCKFFASAAATLLPNLEYLRIVQSTIGSLSSFPLCDFDESCPFIRGLNPRKITFRNVNHQGLPIPEFCDWQPSRLEMVSSYLPPDAKFLHVNGTVEWSATT